MTRFVRNSIELTVEIVTAYVSSNRIRPTELPELIRGVHVAVTRRGTAPTQHVKHKPPLPIARSVTPDYIISFEDGKPYRSLKRHLGFLGIGVDEYIRKWGLPVDYPLVAPNYSKRRSEIAKANGLGVRRSH